MPLFAIVYFVSIPIVMGTGAVVAGTKIFGDTADIILQAFALASQLSFHYTHCIYLSRHCTILANG